MRTIANLVLALVTLVALAALSSAPAATAADVDTEMAARGRATYRVYCASCHGRGAQGDGPVAEVLTVKPADLTMIARDNGGTFPADRVERHIDGRDAVAAHGSRDMPVWGDAFQTEGTADTEEEVAKKIAELTAFVKSIQK